MRNLIVSVEAYPDLKSNQNFLELQRQLAETEDRIAAGRRFYNANVRVYNTKVESVPTNIIANMFKFEKATYFEVNEPAVRQAPDVNFGEIAYRGESAATVSSRRSSRRPRSSSTEPRTIRCPTRRSTSSRRSSRRISHLSRPALSRRSRVAISHLSSGRLRAARDRAAESQPAVAMPEGSLRARGDDLSAARAFWPDCLHGRTRLQQLRRPDGRRGRAGGGRTPHIDAGITLFDTADVYGNGGGSETLLGKALGSRRAEVIIATKFGADMRGANGPDWGARGSRRYIRIAVESSLRRLGTDWIDLYQLHEPDPHTPIEETLAALSEIVAEGKVRYIGSSNLAGWQVIDADWTARTSGYEAFISAQNEYSWLNRVGRERSWCPPWSTPARACCRTFRWPPDC